MFTETYNATGFSATGDPFLSIKNAIILQVPMQRTMPSLNEKRRPIAGPSATGSFIRQNCIYSIYRVESSLRFSSHGKRYITHTDSVRHNKHLHF